jgi:hypothetical protein
VQPEGRDRVHVRGGGGCAAMRSRRTVRRGHGRNPAVAVPFHGGTCYACSAKAVGLRDRRPEGGSLGAAVEFQGRHGKIGRSQDGLYVVEQEEITSRGHKTLGAATKAFAKGGRK